MLTRLLLRKVSWALLKNNAKWKGAKRKLWRASYVFSYTLMTHETVNNDSTQAFELASLL